MGSARHLPVHRLLGLIDTQTTPRSWGFLGERRVNVLELKLALDALHS